MYESENEKMEHQYNHRLEQYLHKNFNENRTSVNDLNDKNTDVMDFLANADNFKNIPNELLAEGKSVIDNHPQIANNQLFIIEPSGQAYVIRVEYQKNIKERELTADEYKIAGIEKC